jgi:hypothetical protein
VAEMLFPVSPRPAAERWPRVALCANRLCCLDMHGHDCWVWKSEMVALVLVTIGPWKPKRPPVAYIRGRDVVEVTPLLRAIAFTLSSCLAFRELLAFAFLHSLAFTVFGLHLLLSC